VLNGAVKPAWTIEFRYPDGLRDCEAVAVDAARGKVILLSKRTIPPAVYELPLSPAKAGVAVAQKIGQTDVTPPPGGFPHPFGAQPTGLDLSADGTLAAVVTYVGIFVFPRNREESWAAAFARKPVVLPRHGLWQAESIAFSRDGKKLFVVSEGARSPIVTYQLQRKN
jgi:DNA-binding beta-propeller fold protein YncE